MINRIKDWKIQIAQLFLPLLVIPIILSFDIPKFIKDLLTHANVSISELEWYWRLAINLSKWELIFLVLVVIYYFIRKYNGKQVLKQNLNVIVWHSFVGYRICRYILNYRKISLTRVPIPVQFKLVLENIFKEYEFNEGITEKEEGTDTVSAQRFQADPFTSTINLALADTYPLNWKRLLPASALNLTTLVIDRVGQKGVRYYSKDFVNTISESVHGLPDNVVEINIFATINAAHVFHIAREVFQTGARDGIKRIRVYEQTKGIWVFEGKNVEIIIGV